MRCSSDLRKRGIDFVRGGGSKAEAARRFQVSRASVYHWVTAPDGLAYQRPGPRGPRRLDWAALRAHVQQYPALTQKERAQHFRVSRHCIWYALRQMGVTWKKKRWATPSGVGGKGKPTYGCESARGAGAKSLSTWMRAGSVPPSPASTPMRRRGGEYTGCAPATVVLGLPSLPLG